MKIVIVDIVLPWRY